MIQPLKIQMAWAHPLIVVKYATDGQILCAY